MKARLLRSLLNNTKYAISNNRNYIAIGSPLCHDLISVDKESLNIKYALDTFIEGKKAIKNPELEFIWDKLNELVESGEIQDIINGRDVIENPLPVFTVKNGKLVESVTDQYGWPNTDDDGWCMYENTHFSNKEQAIEYGIKDYEAGIHLTDKGIEDLQERLEKQQAMRSLYVEYINHLKSL